MSPVNRRVQRGAGNAIVGAAAGVTPAQKPATVVVPPQPPPAVRTEPAQPDRLLEVAAPSAPSLDLNIPTEQDAALTAALDRVNLLLGRMRWINSQGVDEKDRREAKIFDDQITRAMVERGRQTARPGDTPHIIADLDQLSSEQTYLDFASGAEARMTAANVKFPRPEPASAAKPPEEAKPAESKPAAEPAKPVEEAKPDELAKPAAQPTPSEPAEQPKPAKPESKPATTPGPKIESVPSSVPIPVPNTNVRFVPTEPGTWRLEVWDESSKRSNLRCVDSNDTSVLPVVAPKPGEKGTICGVLQNAEGELNVIQFTYTLNTQGVLEVGEPTVVRNFRTVYFNGQLLHVGVPKRLGVHKSVLDSAPVSVYQTTSNQEGKLAVDLERPSACTGASGPFLTDPTGKFMQRLELDYPTRGNPQTVTFIAHAYFGRQHPRAGSQAGQGNFSTRERRSYTATLSLQDDGTYHLAIEPTPEPLPLVVGELEQGPMFVGEVGGHRAYLEKRADGSVELYSHNLNDFGTTVLVPAAQIPADGARTNLQFSLDGKQYAAVISVTGTVLTFTCAEAALVRPDEPVPVVGYPGLQFVPFSADPGKYLLRGEPGVAPGNSVLVAGFVEGERGGLELRHSIIPSMPEPGKTVTVPIVLPDKATGRSMIHDLSYSCAANGSLTANVDPKPKGEYIRVSIAANGLDANDSYEGDALAVEADQSPARDLNFSHLAEVSVRQVSGPDGSSPRLVVTPASGPLQHIFDPTGKPITEIELPYPDNSAPTKVPFIVHERPDDSPTAKVQRRYLVAELRLQPAEGRYRLYLEPSVHPHRLRLAELVGRGPCRALDEAAKPVVVDGHIIYASVGAENKVTLIATPAGSSNDITLCSDVPLPAVDRGTSVPVSLGSKSYGVTISVYKFDGPTVVPDDVQIDFRFKEVGAKPPEARPQPQTGSVLNLEDPGLQSGAYIEIPGSPGMSVSRSADGTLSFAQGEGLTPVNWTFSTSMDARFPTASRNYTVQHLVGAYDDLVVVVPDEQTGRLMRYNVLIIRKDTTTLRFKFKPPRELRRVFVDALPAKAHYAEDLLLGNRPATSTNLPFTVLLAEAVDDATNEPYLIVKPDPQDPRCKGIFVPAASGCGPDPAELHLRYPDRSTLTEPEFVVYLASVGGVPAPFRKGYAVTLEPQLDHYNLVFCPWDSVAISDAELELALTNFGALQVGEVEGRQLFLRRTSDPSGREYELMNRHGDSLCGQFNLPEEGTPRGREFKLQPLPLGDPVDVRFTLTRNPHGLVPTFEVLAVPKPEEKPPEARPRTPTHKGKPYEAGYTYEASVTWNGETQSVERDVVKIGSHRNSHLRIDDPDLVSRIHAVLDLTPGHPPEITDLDSTNGTFVNGVRINKCALYDEDEITINTSKGPAVITLKELGPAKPDDLSDFGAPSAPPPEPTSWTDSGSDGWSGAPAPAMPKPKSSWDWGAPPPEPAASVPPEPSAFTSPLPDLGTPASAKTIPGWDLPSAPDSFPDSDLPLFEARPPPKKPIAPDRFRQSVYTLVSDTSGSKPSARPAPPPARPVAPSVARSPPRGRRADPEPPKVKKGPVPPAQPPAKKPTKPRSGWGRKLAIGAAVLALGTALTYATCPAFRSRSPLPEGPQTTLTPVPEPNSNPSPQPDAGARDADTWSLESNPATPMPVSPTPSPSASPTPTPRRTSSPHAGDSGHGSDSGRRHGTHDTKVQFAPIVPTDRGNFK